MKTISLFLGLINSLLAGLLITFLITSTDFQISTTWWSMIRILIAVAVIVVGILTWVSCMRYTGSGLVAMASLFLVALGPSTIVWTFHRAQLHGHMEYHMIIYGCSLFIQGFSLLFSTAQEAGKVSAA